MTGESHQLRTKCAWNQVCLDLGYWAAWTSTRRNYKKNFALSSLHPMRFFWRPLSYAHWWGPLAQQWWQHWWEFWVSHWMGELGGQRATCSKGQSILLTSTCEPTSNYPSIHGKDNHKNNHWRTYCGKRRTCTTDRCATPVTLQLNTSACTTACPRTNWQLPGLYVKCSPIRVGE